MKGWTLQEKTCSVVWIEPHRLLAGGRSRPNAGLPTEDQLAQVLSALPAGPTSWVLDDRWCPSLLVRNLVDLPSGAEPREAFFRWRYTQSLALQGNWSVQALSLGEESWLLAGISAETRESWLQLALRLQRPIHALMPRWLWAYNQLAPSREAPGLLLSLCDEGDGTYSGTLAAWGQQLTLLRQWPEGLNPEGWWAERILPSLAFLQRDARVPQELMYLGAPTWPDGPLPCRRFPSEIPTQEAR